MAVTRTGQGSHKSETVADDDDDDDIVDGDDDDDADDVDQNRYTGSGGDLWPFSREGRLSKQQK